MKAMPRPSWNPAAQTKIPFAHQRAYWLAIWLTSLTCGGAAMAQTNNPSAVSAAPDSGSSTNLTKLESITVFGKLEEARNKIAADLGASTYAITSEQIQVQSQGANAP